MIHKFNLRFWRLVPKPNYRYKINQPDDFIDIHMPDGQVLLYNKSTGKFGQSRVLGVFTHIIRVSHCRVMLQRMG